MLRAKIPNLLAEIEERDQFKSLYTFTFGFANVEKHESKSLGR